MTDGPLAPTRHPNAGTGHRVLTLGPLQLRLHVRTFWASLALMVAVVLAVGAHVAIGAALTREETLRALIGQGTDLAQTIVWQWRFPRALAALTVGAALGAAGAVFQTITRNPLGSPDVIGLNTGAYTGALTVMLLLGSTAFVNVAVGALIGALATALVIVLLAQRTGRAGTRLILVGLGISAMLSAVNRWIIMTSEQTASMQAASWGAGSLSGLTMARIAPAAAGIAVVVAALVMWGRHLALFSLGEDTYSALGGRSRRDPLVLLALATVLSALATALAGPIAFVALASGQLARLLTRTSAPTVAAAAIMGALVLLVSDLLALHAFRPIQLPTGVVTVVLGGCYLIYLLARERRTA